MSDQSDHHIDHEVRIRVLQEIANDIRSTMKDIHTKIDNQFLWLVGLIFVSIIIPVVLHTLKLT